MHNDYNNIFVQNINEVACGPTCDSLVEINCVINKKNRTK